ncbi:MAG: insulinase family protein [Bacteroidetes bacterium]|nr:insulinase family protein [Bacteroidota bacterium]MBS1755838.1 insulinase family protein [Bacteroidota bacterium]
MIHFERFTLDNGLRILVHQDKSTAMVALDVLYDVGARDENPDKTGFAHLFEHLMFGGSINIPSYDEPLQLAGGENNAFTSNDITNYHCELPAENIETAFWLESDRMLSLAFSKKSLEVQRKVVCEEFKEHYINKPYGDVWNKLRTLAYTTHPYKWMTIGKELKHVEDASLQDVKDFFHKHYTPCNAILVVAGNIDTAQVKALAEKWFTPIPAGEKYIRNIPQEPKQTAPRFLEVKADVPLDALYKCWHIYPRMDERYYTADLISDILSGGGSSRLYQSLVKEKKLFSNIECYHLGSSDAGIMVIEGKLVKGTDIKLANAAIEEELNNLKENGITETELEKVKNKSESAMAFEDMSLVNRATSIAIYEVLGDANLINTELEKYHAVTVENIKQQSQIIFNENNCSTMYYLSNN